MPDKAREQDLLLQIVETWRPSEKPEYRGFRCANCQAYKNEAWYHWLDTNGYRLPVHLCNDTCESAFQNETIQIDSAKRQPIDRKTFGNNYEYSKETQNRLAEIIKSWPENAVPELKAFSCDRCGNDLEIDLIDEQRKGYHVWYKMPDGKTLVELHFHKECGNILDINE
jgi:hypothetical protein